MQDIFIVSSVVGNTERFVNKAIGKLAEESIHNIVEIKVRNNGYKGALAQFHSSDEAFMVTPSDGLDGVDVRNVFVFCPTYNLEKDGIHYWTTPALVEWFDFARNLDKVGEVFSVHFGNRTFGSDFCRKDENLLRDVEPLMDVELAGTLNDVNNFVKLYKAVGDLMDRRI